MLPELTEDHILKVINETPALVSILYDVNLLPEQLKKDDVKWSYMLTIALAYLIGKHEYEFKR